MLVEEIAQKVREAVNGRQKIAMFHLQVLVNSEKLKGLDPVSFCKDLGLPESYAIEFSKMLALARLMKEQGVKISNI